MICSFSGIGAIAQTSTNSLVPDISSLEKRFFDHTYPTDTVDDRIDRLEHMVFGETKTGSDSDRLTALLVAVPEEPAATASSSTPASAGDATTPNQTANIPPATASSPATDNTDYPRVDQLEQEIEGKTFAQEPVQKRLEQLETKAFGKPSTSDDLSARTDALERYADKHFHTDRSNYQNTAYGAQNDQPISTAPPRSGYASSSYSSPQGVLPPTASLEQKVTWLEQQVFGQTQPGQPLLDRVDRLETNLFPTDSKERTTTLTDQINSMIGAVELNPRDGAPTLASAPPYQPPQLSEAPQAQPQYNEASAYAPPQYSEAPQYNQVQDNPYQNPPPENSLAQTAQTQDSQTKHRQHPLIHGLAHALGTVGSLAARSAPGLLMGGYGMGGFGW